MKNNIVSHHKVPITRDEPIQQSRHRKEASKTVKKENLDQNQNGIIDYVDLISIMTLVKKAKTIGITFLSPEELSQIDIDRNNTFNENDETLIQKGLKNHPKYKYVNNCINNISVDPQGEINIRSAKRFTNSLKKSLRRFNILEAQGEIGKLPQTIINFDCDENNILDQQDRICAIDFIRESLKQNYPEKRVLKFLKKNNISK